MTTIPQPNRTRRLAGALTLLCAAGSAAGCLDNELEPGDSGGVTGTRSFIAQNGAFAHYRDWTTSEENVMDDHGGVVGTTTVYFSEMPDEVTHMFPVGSILVKTMQATGAEELTIHAMTKRGRGYNPKGALGWEYFELLLNKAGLPNILWRGETPPTGESYQMLLGAANSAKANDAQSEGDCNGCHAMGRDGMLGDSVLELLDAQ
jgi:hypothetical protein